MGIAKLRSVYLREAVDRFRGERALVGLGGNQEERLEVPSKLEETWGLDGGP